MSSALPYITWTCLFDANGKTFKQKVSYKPCELNNNNKHQNSHGSIYLLVVSTQLKNISQNRSFLQIGVKIKHISNHHLLVVIYFHSEFANVFSKIEEFQLHEKPPTQFGEKGGGLEAAPSPPSSRKVVTDDSSADCWGRLKVVPFFEGIDLSPKNFTSRILFGGLDKQKFPTWMGWNDEKFCRK